LPLNSGVAVGLGLDRVGCGAAVAVAVAAGVGLDGRAVAVAAVVAVGVGLGGKGVSVGTNVVVGKGDAVGTGVCVETGVTVASATSVGSPVGGAAVGVGAKGRVQPARTSATMTSKMVTVPRFVCLIPPSFSGLESMAGIGFQDYQTPGSRR
jgi:hypothetical protein